MAESKSTFTLSQLRSVDPATANLVLGAYLAGLRRAAEIARFGDVSDTYTLIEALNREIAKTEAGNG